MENHSNGHSTPRISRRKWLATMGAVGVTLAAGTFPANKSFGEISDKRKTICECDLILDNISKVAALDSSSLAGNRIIRILSWHPSAPSNHFDQARGGGVFVYESTRPKADHNGGTILSLTMPFTGNVEQYLNRVGDTDPSGTGCLVRLAEGPVSVRWFGAVGDGISNDRASVQAAVDFVGQLGGGSVYTPTGTYKVIPESDQYACIWIPYSHIEMYGDGEASVIFTTQDAHVPIHVSPERNLTVNSIAGEVTGFSLQHMCIRGTGTFTYFALAKGRGVLLRKVKDVIVSNNFIYGMSMIGICAEHGNGNFLVSNNIVENCKYTAINYNGRCAQSIISNNICSGSDANVNSVSIQASGHCLVTGNTVFGSISNFSNCGGIMWGEGPYHGIGTISNNLIKHCRFGIKTVFHGPCNILGNTIINCRTTSGIVLVGTTGTGMQVASTDNLVSGNTVINCFPSQIETSAARSQIHGNKLVHIPNPVSPSLNTEPDFIQDVRPAIGIRTSIDDCSITCNDIDGSIRGIVVREGKRLGVIEGNDIRNTAGELIVWEAAELSGTYVAMHASVPTRTSTGNGTYIAQIWSAGKPSQGFWETGTIWNRVPLQAGLSRGEAVIHSAATLTAASAAGGEVILSVVSAAGIAPSSGNIIGVRLDNKTFHWCSVTAVTGNAINLSAAIPSGRSVASSAPVVYQQWISIGDL